MALQFGQRIHGDGIAISTGFLANGVTFQLLSERS